MSPRRWARGWLQPCAEVHHMWLIADALWRGYAITVLCSTSMALVVGLGAPSRFTGPAWSTVNLLGGHVAWGALFAVLALGLCAAPRLSAQAIGWALQIAGTVYLTLAIGFGFAAFKSEFTAGTGIVAYGAVALWHISQAEAYKTRRP